MTAGKAHQGACCALMPACRTHVFKNAHPLLLQAGRRESKSLQCITDVARQLNPGQPWPHSPQIPDKPSTTETDDLATVFWSEGEGRRKSAAAVRRANAGSRAPRNVPGALRSGRTDRPKSSDSGDNEPPVPFRPGLVLRLRSAQRSLQAGVAWMEVALLYPSRSGEGNWAEGRK